LDVNAGDGIQIIADAVAVDVSDFAGTGLEDDGSENLRIAAAAAGDGLNGGSGSALSVDAGDGLQIGGGVGGATALNIDVSDFAGTNLEDDGSENLRIAASAAGDGLDGGGASALSVDAGDGLQIGGGIGGATAVNIDVSDFAGTGLEDDGSENLRIAAAAAGDGLTGGAGSALAVDPDGDSISVSASGVKAAVPAPDNKEETPVATSAIADQATGLTIAATPAGDGYVHVILNGVVYRVGDGVKTGDFYYTNDSGVTARAISAIASGDELFVGSDLGFAVESTDVVSQDFNKIV
jgi:hypothetical protein